MPTTGADLPSELLSHIIYHLQPMITDTTLFDEDRRARQGLTACSLVCRHWSNVISPMLFEFITLRSLGDIHFLMDVIDKGTASRSFLLSSSIQTIWLHQDVSQSRPWLHHAHAFSTRLPRVSFNCTIYRKLDDDRATTGASAIQACIYSPFRSLPRTLPLSILRLSHLTLDGLQFASKTELARFIDSFPTLKECRCGQLTFLDPSPILQSRRRRRHPSPSLEWSTAWRCNGIGLATQAVLASDIIMASAHLALDGDEWSTVLQALVALAPGSFDRAAVSRDGLGTLSHCCNIHENLSFFLLAWVQVHLTQGSRYMLGDDAL